MDQERTGFEVAVIGMSCKVPGAKNIAEFWRNLESGIESIKFFSSEELEIAGISKKELDSENYIKANSFCNDIECFDAAFFDYSNKEALLMDPQLRIFHECVWEALEHSGYIPDNTNMLTGLFAGASYNNYWDNLCTLMGVKRDVGLFNSRTFNIHEYFCSRIAYKFNFQGPCIQLNTACSTSLTSVYMAYQSLLIGDCDLALAGSVSVLFPDIIDIRKNWFLSPQMHGYYYSEGMIYSKDGHCRPFDKDSHGTVFGSGAGVVVLKRLDDAIRDNDNIYAIIKGGAINNDGKMKIGFTAPSIDNQSEVIKISHKVSSVDPETITYVEAHGSGTILGDPIEIAALKLAFNTSKRNYCYLGSVKSNLGHLDTAAGVAGFIKTVLSLKNKVLPPLLNFKSINPKIDIANSPFKIADKRVKWDNDGMVRRAGVSSFGLGGTNVHMVLEEFPEYRNKVEIKRNNILVISGNTMQATMESSKRLLNYLREYPETNINDIAYTYQIARKLLPFRLKVSCSDYETAINGLESVQSSSILKANNEVNKGKIVFVLPGYGTQYTMMGLGLYSTEDVFRRELDHCFNICEKVTSINLKDILFKNDEYNGGQLNDFTIGQLALFVFQYSLIKLLDFYGVQPDLLYGLSISEYTIACVLGVFSIEDCIKLLYHRGELIKNNIPEAEIICVSEIYNNILPLLTKNIHVTVDNGLTCLVAGETGEMKVFKDKLKENKVFAFPVNSSYAVHSELIQPIIEKFGEVLDTISFSKPQKPYVSCITGELVDEEIISKNYWIEHLKNKVNFNESIDKLIDNGKNIIVDIGPGNSMASSISKFSNEDLKLRIINLSRLTNERKDDQEYLLDKLGILWQSGVSINWNNLYGTQKPNRISLPTYPFQKAKFWFDNESLKKVTENHFKNHFNEGNGQLEDKIYEQSWKRISFDKSTGISVDNEKILFFINDKQSEELVKSIKDLEVNSVIVKSCGEFKKLNENYFHIDSSDFSNYDRLFEHLDRIGFRPTKIFHFLSVDFTSHKKTSHDLSDETVNVDLNNGLYSIIHIAKTTAKYNLLHSIKFYIITNNTRDVLGNDLLYPIKSTIIGGINTIAAEYVNLNCYHIDVDEKTNFSAQFLIQMQELENSDFSTLAIRGRYFWVPEQNKVNFKVSLNNRIEQGGVYVISGGLGGIGILLTKYLVKEKNASVILLTRKSIPPKDKWSEILNKKVQLEEENLLKIEELNNFSQSIFIYKVNVSVKEEVNNTIKKIREEFNSISGVFHLAGITKSGIIQNKTEKDIWEELEPKINGTNNIINFFSKLNPEFIMLFSSLDALLPRIGQVGYASANNYLESVSRYYHARGKSNIRCVHWCAWNNVGMDKNPDKRKVIDLEQKSKGLNGQIGIDPVEGLSITDILCQQSFESVIVANKHVLNYLSIKTRHNTNSEKTTEFFQNLTTTINSEDSILNIFKNYLGMNNIDVNKNFFELGLNSMDILQIRKKIRESLNIELSIPLLYANPTIIGLNKLLTNNGHIESDIDENDIINKLMAGKKRFKTRKKNFSNE